MATANHPAFVGFEGQQNFVCLFLVRAQSIKYIAEWYVWAGMWLWRVRETLPCFISSEAETAEEFGLTISYNPVQ